MGVIPTVQAAQLAGSNVDDFRKFKKKKTGHGIVKSGVKNIVGINLIKTEADLIASL